MPSFKIKGLPIGSADIRRAAALVDLDPRAIITALNGSVAPHRSTRRLIVEALTAIGRADAIPPSLRGQQ